jgi:hypothetical protein
MNVDDKKDTKPRTSEGIRGIITTDAKNKSKSEITAHSNASKSDPEGDDQQLAHESRSSGSVDASSVEEEENKLDNWVCRVAELKSVLANRHCEKGSAVRGFAGSIVCMEPVTQDARQFVRDYIYIARSTLLIK